MLNSGKLEKNSEFRRVLASRKAAAGPLLRLKALPAEDAAAGTRFGLAVGRRVGGAVVRNRVKRRLREQMRNMGAVGAWDIVVIAGPESAAAHSRELAGELRTLLRKAGVELDA